MTIQSVLHQHPRRAWQPGRPRVYYLVALAYALNRRWTFQAEHSTKRLIAVCILYAVTFGLNVGIFHVVYKATLSLGHLWAKTIGFVVGQAVATIVNFIVQRTVIFRVR